MGGLLVTASFDLRKCIGKTMRALLPAAMQHRELGPNRYEQILFLDAVGSSPIGVQGAEVNEELLRPRQARVLLV